MTSMLQNDAAYVTASETFGQPNQHIPAAVSAHAAPTNHMSRRSVMNAFVSVASVAAVPVAIPSRAFGAIPDPVFAAIEQHRHARLALSPAFDEFNAAEERAKQAGCLSNSDVCVYVPAHLTEAELDVIDLLPGDGTTNGLSEAQLEILNKSRVAKCYSAEHIEKYVATNPHPESHAELCELAKQRLEAKQAKHREARERVGLTQAEARKDAACDAENDATDALIEVVPTTMVGVLTRLSYVFETFDQGDAVFDDSDILATLLESTFDALKQLQTS